MGRDSEFGLGEARSNVTPLEFMYLRFCSQSMSRGTVPAADYTTPRRRPADVRDAERETGQEQKEKHYKN